jgi:serine/threonine protein kinase
MHALFLGPLQVVPNLAQPVVKLPVQLLARGLPAPAQANPCSSDFTPPECSDQLPANSVVGSSCGADLSTADVWACGVMLLMLLGGCLQQLQSHLQLWEQQSHDQLVMLLQGMLHRDPSQRYTVDQILRDPWFRHQLPPAASDMSARFLSKPSTCTQTAADLEHLLQLACAAGAEDLQQLSAAAAHQFKTQFASTSVFASAEQLFAGVQFQVGQDPIRDSSGCLTFMASRQGQAVQVVGVASLLGPRGPSFSQSTDRQPAAALQAADIIPLVSSAHSSAAFMRLAATLQQLQQAQQREMVASGCAGAGSYAPVLAPVHSMCMEPPMMVLPKPVGGSLQQWISHRIGSLTEAAGASDVVPLSRTAEAWVAAVPWHSMLQALCDVAEGLYILHQQQPAVVHGGVHAAAVHLLQQLPVGGAAAKQQGEDGDRVAQLSLTSLLAQLSPLSSCHPFLCAPEVLLASGPATPAADVYGFGVLLFQLATGWLPQQYTPGTDEQICAVMWCRDMMSHAGSTSPLAAAQLLAAQQAGKVKLATGEWTPYKKHLPSAGFSSLNLPAGYLELMEQCLHRQPAARPTICEALARLHNIPITGSPPSAPARKVPPSIEWHVGLPYAPAHKWMSWTHPTTWTCSLICLKRLMNKGLCWLTCDRVPLCNNPARFGLPRSNFGSSKTSKGVGDTIISCMHAVAGLVMLATV